MSRFESLTYLQSAGFSRDFVFGLEIIVHTHTHTCTLAQMKLQMTSTVILRHDKGPLASFSVNVSSWEREVCRLVSDCVFVHSSFLAVNYVILLLCCLMELLCDAMSVYLCVCTSVSRSR